MRNIQIAKKWTKKEETKARLLMISYDEFKYHWNRSKEYLLLESQEKNLSYLEDLFRVMYPVLRNNVNGFTVADTLEHRLSSYMSAAQVNDMDSAIRSLTEISKFKDNVFARELDGIYRKEIRESARELKNKLSRLRKNM